MPNKNDHRSPFFCHPSPADVLDDDTADGQRHLMPFVQPTAEALSALGETMDDLVPRERRRIVAIVQHVFSHWPADEAP
jgi:hypothetical protein